MPFIDEMSAKIFGPDYPRASELESKTVLALVNSHPALDFPEVLPPNVYVFFLNVYLKSTTVTVNIFFV